MSHFKNIAKNTMYSYAYIIVIKIVKFVTRTIFIYTLGVTYLGLDGLLTNVLGILSFTELGIGGVIYTSLYKPIAEKDYDKIRAYINIFKKAYFVIAMLISLFGIILLFFLDRIVKDYENITVVKISYLIYLFNTVISYFAICYYSMPRCNERAYIVTSVQSACYVLLGIIQSLVLIFTHNLYFYLFSQTFVIIFERVVLYFKIKKIYPWLFKQKNSTELNNSDKEKLVKNVKAAIGNKFFDVVISFTDNIIISTFIGLNSVGYASNYEMLSNTIYILGCQIFFNLTASIGNIIYNVTLEYKNKVLHAILFFAYFVFGYSSIIFICIVNNFVYFWIGKEFIIDIKIVCILGSIFFIKGLRIAYFSNKDAYAVFYDDYFYGIYAAFINIVVSIVLALKLGLIGVFIGTLLTELFLLLVKASSSYEYLTTNKKTTFILKIIYYIFCYLIVLIISLIVSKKILVYGSILRFVFGLIIISIIFVIVNLIFFIKNNDAKFLLKYVNEKIKFFI